MFIEQIYYPNNDTGKHFKNIDNVYLNKILKPYHDKNKPSFF